MENLKIMENSTNNKFIEEEFKLVNRKDIFGHGKDLEKLQEDFLKTQNEKNLSVKITKNKIKNELIEKEKISQEIDSINNSAPTLKISKKKKDLITMDLNVEYGANLKKENKNISIFKQAIEYQNEFKEIKNKNIKKDTSLPETFKVDLNSLEKSRNLHIPRKSEKINSKDKFLQEMTASIIANSDYKNIHDSNLSAIIKMSREELIQYQQMIQTKIPDKLKEKMRSGYFQKKLREETELKKLNLQEETEISNKDNPEEIKNEILSHIDNIKSNEEEKENLSNSENKNMKSKFSEETFINQNESNIESINSLSFDILVNYNGEFSMSTKNLENKIKPTQSFPSAHKIDYTKYKFKEVDLNNKNFTIAEIFNLLASTSEQQILLGLKLSKLLLDLYFDPNLEQLIERLIENEKINKNKGNFHTPNVTKEIHKQIEELNLWNIFYNLTECKNINIKIISLDLFVSMILKLFKYDFKFFSYNFFQFGNFPGKKIINNEPKYLKIIESCFMNNLHKNLIFLKNSFVIFKSPSFDDKTHQNFRNLLNFLYFNFYFNEEFASFYYKSEIDSLLLDFLKEKKNILIQENNSELTKVIKKIYREIYLQASSLEVLKNYQTEFEKNSIEFLSNDINLNFISLLRGADQQKYFSSNFKIINNYLKEDKAIAYNILIKLVNEKNLDYILKFDKNNSNLKTVLESDLQNSNVTLIREFIRISKLLQYKMKLFKYSNHFQIEEDATVFNLICEMNYLENLFVKSLLFVEEEILIKTNKTDYCKFPILKDLNIIFDFWKTLITFQHFTKKFPNSIRFMKPLNEAIFKNLFDSTIKLTKILLSQIEEAKIPPDSENSSIIQKSSKIQLLYKLENFTKYLLSFLKHFSQPHYEVRDEIPYLFFIFPSFLNTNCEYYYNKFIKYLTLFFYKKSSEQEIQKILRYSKFSFDELCVDMNLYLGSNEDLRKSTIVKNILNLKENLTNPILKFQNEKDSAMKSKFLPLSKNFILQILFNNKIKTDLKLNYMILMIVMFYNQELNPDNFNPFEIILKILNNFGDEINMNKAEFIFSEFIRNLVLFERSEKDRKIKNLKKISLNRNLETEILFETFFDKFQFSNENEVQFYYKFVFLFIIMFHSNKKPNFKIDKLNEIIYSNFSPILKYSDLSLLKFLDSNNERDLFINYIYDNMSIQNLEFYEVCIISYFRFLLNNKDNSSKTENNLFIELIERIIKRLNLIKNDEERLNSIERIYHEYLKDNKSFRQIIEKELR